MSLTMIYNKKDLENPVEILKILLICPSITPHEGGALTVLEQLLTALDFSVERPIFKDENTPDIENLYAKSTGCGLHLMFAGHTDVVPVGDEAAWSHPPFGAEIENNILYGRGAVDMKGGIACFIAATARFKAKYGAVKGSISLLITGDEEGPAINGTCKLLQWATEKGDKWDAALVGEPTNLSQIGDMIKIGRRGSLSGTLIVTGIQGHVAYPHLADNPISSLMQLLEGLKLPNLDAKSCNFPCSNLEITAITVENQSVNVIPAQAHASFNIRFNDNWSVQSLVKEIQNRLQNAAQNTKYRSSDSNPISYQLTWRDRPSDVFLTKNTALIDILSAAVFKITGTTPKLSTTGGTSDARFIKDYCPVVEFGLVGQTMHMVDERVSVADLEALTRIYEQFLVGFFS
jgi:succinyl-diaminopimelate desuccinylase